jgi:hypothetical protein
VARAAAGVLLLAGLAGCVTPAPAPAPALQAAGLKRIAVARPAFANRGIVLDSHTGDYQVTESYREFCNVLEAELQKNGFSVLDYCTRPNTSYIGMVYPVPSVGPEEADVILVPDLGLGYSALNNLHSYKLRDDCSYALIDVRTRKVLYVGHVRLSGMQPSSYFLLDSLVADMDRAKAAVHQVAVALGTSVGQRVK